MRVLLISLVAISLLVSCNSSTKKDLSKIDIQSEIIGKWIQPIPGQKDQQQGFELKTDNSAKAINIHTLKYDKWKLSKDTLFLSGHTVGVAELSSFTDTLLVTNLSDSKLILLYKGDVESNKQVYHRAK